MLIFLLHNRLSLIFILLYLLYYFFSEKGFWGLAQHPTYQDASHCVHSAWVFMVGCPVEWDLAFDVRNPNVGVMLDEQLRMLWVVVVCAPVQSCLLQGREVLKKATSASCSSRTSPIRQAWCKSHQDTLRTCPSIDPSPHHYILDHNSGRSPQLYQSHTGTRNLSKDSHLQTTTLPKSPPSLSLRASSPH